MTDTNLVIVTGRLTRDVELRTTPSGKSVTDIGLAVNNSVKVGDEWKDKTTFLDITVWGRTAEAAEKYLRKGSRVLFEARLDMDSWEKDGRKHSKLKLLADKMQMLGGKQEAREEQDIF